MPNQSTVLIETPEELARLREDLLAFYRPVGSQERLAVERVAFAQQSMLRAARLETSLFASSPEGELHTILETEAFKVFLRYQAQAERSYRYAVKELRSLQAERGLAPPAPQPAAPSLKPPPLATAPAAPSSPPPAPAKTPAAARATAAAGNLALRL
ncbi:MAG TPA: hypothetical protein VME43_31660 [Bryobacteraceae bacterium]|nr:hypothetical protein [Bryobacteraceae bacterium]